MNVSLTPELEELVNEKVRSGLYNSTSEVVQEALRLLCERDHLRQQELDALHAKIDRGLTQLNRGEGIPERVALRRLRANRQTGQ